jgi:hypothetical protein
MTGMGLFGSGCARLGRLRDDRLRDARIRKWTHFRKPKRNKKDTLLLLYKATPLTVKADDTDWESYRR